MKRLRELPPSGDEDLDFAARVIAETAPLEVSRVRMRRVEIALERGTRRGAPPRVVRFALACVLVAGAVAGASAAVVRQIAHRHEVEAVRAPAHPTSQPGQRRSVKHAGEPSVAVPAPLPVLATAQPAPPTDAVVSPKVVEPADRLAGSRSNVALATSSPSPPTARSAVPAVEPASAHTTATIVVPRPRPPTERDTLPRVSAIEPSASTTPADEAVPTRFDDVTTSALPIASAPVVAAAPPREEAQLVARAMQLLRVEHDTVRAAHILDDYLERYPHGALLEEALVLDVEAASGHDDARAAELSRAYLNRFPDGRHAEAARRMAASASTIH